MIQTGLWPGERPGFGRFGHLKFVLLICFGFRASNFLSDNETKDHTSVTLF